MNQPAPRVILYLPLLMGYAAHMQHPFHLMPDMMVGPWRIKARLGSGGFGAVFRVECGGEEYALKFAVHGPDSEDLNRTDARARRELACLLLLTHPHVVRVWAHGRWPHPRTGYHYIVMDYVEGLTLTEWVKKTRPTLRQVLQLFGTVALTLDALHAQGLHHRDLKGSNILVRARDGAPVLVDFGAAEHALEVAVPLTEGPLPPGTPHLRTPEALRFQRERYADPAARYLFRPTDDLYALGATLYEVLTGVAPFPPHLPREVLVSLIETKLPPSPDVLNAQVPPALAALVLRLLAKRPEERPASGRSLHEQLQAVLHEGAPSLDLPLLPGAEAATTEGMGGSPGGEASAPSVLPERASPRAPAPRPPRRASVAVAALALLSLLGAGLWRGGVFSPRPSGTPPEPPASALVATPPPERAAEPPRTELLADAGPPPRSGVEAGPPPAASASSDAEPQVVAEALPSSPQKKGLPMRTKPPTKRPEVPPEPVKPRSPEPRAASPLPGVLAACVVGTAGCSPSPPLPVRYGPPPAQKCPPGSLEFIQSTLGLTRPEQIAVMLSGAPDTMMNKPVEVREGKTEVTAFLGTNWNGAVPSGSAFVGEFTFGDRLYGRFTRLRFPNGESFPFCGSLYEDNWGGTPGVPWLPGSVPGAMRVIASQALIPDLDGEH